MVTQYIIRFSPDRGLYRGRFLYLGKAGKVIESRRGAERFATEQEAQDRLTQITTHPTEDVNLLGDASIVANFTTIRPE